MRAVAAFPGPGGRILLATGSLDHTVRIWDPEARLNLAVLHLDVNVEAIVAVDTRLAVATDEGVLVLAPYEPAATPPATEEHDLR